MSLEIRLVITLVLFQLGLVKLKSVVTESFICISSDLI